MHVERRGNRYALRTAPDLAPYLQREQIQTRRLSRAALETLAILAYHQPITRAELEEMRGVSVSKGTLDLLLETGWVAPKGRRDTPGRPVTWVTTRVSGPFRSRLARRSAAHRGAAAGRPPGRQRSPAEGKGPTKPTPERRKTMTLDGGSDDGASPAAGSG